MPITIFMPDCYSRTVLQLAVGGVLLSAGLVMAQEKSQAESRQESPQKMVAMPVLKVGDATHKLLALQASGAVASDLQHPMPVAVAEKIYQRYLDSFSHPIPEKSGSALEKLQ